jgi:hypothetical protein
LGAVIDFLVGKAGQKRARDRLETWWIKFDDVRWNNFGREEAEFAISLIDRWCGRRLFSLGRWVFVLIISVMLITIGYIVDSIMKITNTDPYVPFRLFDDPILNLEIFISSVLGFAVSISLTRLVAVMARNYCGNGRLTNFVVFLFF